MRAVMALAAAILALGTTVSAQASRGVTVELRASESANAPAAGSVQLYSKSYALVIGIDAYQKGWPRLDKAVEDARVVAEELKRQGFEVSLKTDLDAAQLPKALKEFFAIKGADPEARLLLWYAGHGHTIDGEGFLVPADAPPATTPLFKATALPMRDFGSLVRLAESKHVLAIFDSCFSGTIFQARAGAAPAAITKKTTKPVRQFITSGDAGQQVRDDGSFREYFLRAIKGDETADFNGDGYVTGEEIGLYLNQRMSALTQAAQTPKAGKLHDVKYNEGDFVFVLPRGAPTVAAPAPAPGPAALPAGSADREALFWTTIKDSRNAADFEAYLKRFPDGDFASLARNRLTELKAPQVAAVQPIGVVAGPSRDMVAEAQRLLAELGYTPGPADGVAGQGTRAAIEAFQRSNGLVADGEVSEPLLAALRVASRRAALARKPKVEREVSPRSIEDEFQPYGRRWKVDASGRGDFRTIGEAIDHAMPGDAIDVAPGTYEENLIIVKELYIQGTGRSAAEVVIKAMDADCVAFEAEKGAVRNMTMRYVGGENYFCVDVTGGQLLLSGNDLSSNGLAVVAAHGLNADPVIVGNRIHGGKQSGIFVYDAGKGRFENNDIYGNELPGVEVTSRGNPIFSGNRIHDGKQGGFYIHTDAKGRYENNDIFGNALAGIEVKTGADPVFVGNRVHDGMQGGIFVHTEGRGRFENNDIFGNALPGVEVKSGADPVFIGNRIHDGKQGGIFVQVNAKGRFENNDIYANGLSGVEVKEGADPLFIGNRIHSGKQSGVYVQGGAKGRFENNDIFGNAYAGVEVKSGADPLFTGNRIRDGLTGGIFVQAEGRGRFENNEIFGNTYAGVEVKTGGDPLIVRNRIRNGKGRSIYIYENGKGRFENNEIYGNALPMATEGGNPVLVGNSVRDG